MVGRGNPLKIESLQDLIDRKARFVNRDHASGTRLLFDQLLALHRIDESQINGAQQIEFTLQYAMFVEIYRSRTSETMKQDGHAFTECEVTADDTVTLGFADSNGSKATVRLTNNQVGALAMTLPEMIAKALRTRYGDQTLRYACPLASWAVEQSTDPKTGMMTLGTEDGFSVCFSMGREIQTQLGQALASARLPVESTFAN